MSGTTPDIDVCVEALKQKEDGMMFIEDRSPIEVLVKRIQKFPGMSVARCLVYDVGPWTLYHLVQTPEFRNDLVITPGPNDLENLVMWNLTRYSEEKDLRRESILYRLLSRDRYGLASAIAQIFGDSDNFCASQLVRFACWDFIAFRPDRKGITDSMRACAKKFENEEAWESMHSLLLVLLRYGVLFEQMIFLIEPFLQRPRTGYFATPPCNKYQAFRRRLRFYIEGKHRPVMDDCAGLVGPPVKIEIKGPYW